jgi:hypothetical protein
MVLLLRWFWREGREWSYPFTSAALGVRRLESGETEGLDPREMDRSLLETIGHSAKPLLRAIREKCLDCSHTAPEVRRCTAVDCALWPYRLGTNPFRAERSEAQKLASLAAAERLKTSRDEAGELAEAINPP